MADSDGNMNLRGRKTEVERKEHRNEGSGVGNGKNQAGFESPNQEAKKQGKRPKKQDGRRTKYDAEEIVDGNMKIFIFKVPVLTSKIRSGNESNIKIPDHHRHVDVSL
ncbi:hypothetical protein AVEN_16453-1 [Araneus ventricosus]|uniref:Uncharacterized protein n=1 Tax=Araneus ventricosus TaxID=182803 RepID=A0A4Y2IR93_ARAVE|nr:hypothetical protein AVEN_16453-1 [Araneus ventricosus]